MITAILLAGGIGSRLGQDIPKQYIKVAQRTIFSYSLETLSKSDKIDAIWIVADKTWHYLIQKDIRKYDIKHKVKGFSQPGVNRQLSIYQAMIDLKAKAKNDDFVFIHDAVRPLLTLKDIQEYVLAIEEYDGVIPVLPMKDTVYLSLDGKTLTSRLNRSQVVAGQAPEIFAFQKYLDAVENLIHWINTSDGQVISLESEIFKINGSAEPAVMAQMNLRIVEGNEENFKITTPMDLDRFIEIMEGNQYESLGFRRY
ncbi:IspD/TarI family cytidylyltransferase [Enterococcus cecorum]|uniref:IspD/TarI family cytidylyltransferase n=1 Tax=Enterococcus cecorum TaxID=44008 RepID=UPI0032C4B1F8